MTFIIDNYISQLKSYQHTHPNLVGCWVAYLELKKRHYADDAHSIKTQCDYVLERLLAGHGDFEQKDLFTLIIYKFMMRI